MVYGTGRKAATGLGVDVSPAIGDQHGGVLQCPAFAVRWEAVEL